MSPPALKLHTETTVHCQHALAADSPSLLDMAFEMQSRTCARQGTLSPSPANVMRY